MEAAHQMRGRKKGAMAKEKGAVERERLTGYVKVTFGKMRVWGVTGHLIARLYANQNAKHGARLQCHGSALAATSRRALRLHDPYQRARRAARVRRRGRGRRAGGRGGRRGRPCCAGGRVGAPSRFRIPGMVERVMAISFVSLDCSMTRSEFTQGLSSAMRTSDWRRTVDLESIMLALCKSLSNVTAAPMSMSATATLFMFSVM